MKVSWQCHTTPALSFGNEPLVPTRQEAGKTPVPIWMQWQRKKTFTLTRNWTQILQISAHHFHLLGKNRQQFSLQCWHTSTTEYEVISQKTVILNSYGLQEWEHTRIRKCQEGNEINTLVLSTSQSTNFLKWWCDVMYQKNMLSLSLRCGD